jgi:hypothetical protein
MARLGCSQLIVDLSEATSVDPAAVALLELANAVRLRRTMVAVVCPPGDLATALEEHTLTVVSTVDEAHERFALAADA